MLRDPTRGGLAASLNEIAATACVGIEIVERQVPVPPEVADACAILGLDPFYVANEGRLVAVVPPVDADRVLAVMRGLPAEAVPRSSVGSQRSTPRWWWRARGSGRREWWTCRWVSSCPASADPDGA